MLTFNLIITIRKYKKDLKLTLFVENTQYQNLINFEHLILR